MKLKDAKFFLAMNLLGWSLLGTPALGQVLATHRATSDSSGIYLTARDFEAHRLSFGFPCGSHHAHIHAFGRPRISVKTATTKHVFRKGAVFGFRDCGQDYRVYARDEYRILDTTEFFVYSQSYEIAVSPGLSRTVTKYYFSESPKASIFPLTRRYLSWVFRERETFLRLVQESIQSDEDLARFDEKSHLFLAERLMREAVE